MGRFFEAPCCTKKLSSCSILMNMLMKPVKVMVPNVKYRLMYYNHHVRNDLAVVLTGSWLI